MENLTEKEKQLLSFLIEREIERDQNYAIKSIVNDNPIFNKEDALQRILALEGLREKLN